MLSVSNISKQHGHQILLIDASFHLSDGEKAGLVGPNGAGKSTIFRMLVGEETPDDGQIEVPKRLTIGYFRQDVGDLKGRSVVDEAMAGAGEVGALGVELKHLESRLGDVDSPDFDQVMDRFGEVTARYSELGGYDLESQARSILSGLGFAQSQMDQDIGAMSGGWKMRVALAQILLAKPDVLLLDEPTNYLDLESILWLEEFLKAYPGSVLMTCHDRDVLNRLVKKIIEIDGGTLRSYSGDYDFYERARLEDAARREAEYERQQAMLAKEARFIERFKAQAAKAAQVQSRVKKLEKIEKVEMPPRIIEREFDFRAPPRSGDDVVSALKVTKSYGGRAIYQDFDFLVRRGERWAVLGENGAGKSTLLKMLSGVLPTDSGEVIIGPSTSIGYFAQHHMDQLAGDRTLLEELQAHAPTANMGVLRNLAGAFGFSGDDHHKPIRVLSGGERTRVALAKILYDAPNLLILDEPTNHLDIVTKRMLVRTLGKYESTMIFVSHDRWFLHALANRVVEVVPGRAPRLYGGSYKEYVAATGHEAPGMRELT